VDIPVAEGDVASREFTAIAGARQKRGRALPPIEIAGEKKPSTACAVDGCVGRMG
jgi:hypothetical protein